MRILQMDVDSVSYELVKPESSTYERTDKRSGTFKNVVLLMTAIEKGDTEDTARRAMQDASKFAAKQKSSGIVVYPFAHLSDDLESPDKSLKIIDEMRRFKTDGIEVHSAPFGWNKKLIIDVKGHPLAEMSRRYTADSSGRAGSEKRPGRPETRTDLSMIRKSDWSGLPDSDHRTIGERLDLYSAQEISPGMVYWHPNGHIIYREIVKMLREMYDRYEYQEISTPILANTALWRVSGHMGHYKENMFTTEYDAGTMGMKPMNCPSTIMVYKTKKWSYRELPFRTAIFDRLFRRELSGVLGGLTRVQEFSQDDGHIFLREDQISEEIGNTIGMVSEVYKIFGFEYIAKLSTKDPSNYMGEDEAWERATSALVDSLRHKGIDYEIKEGDAAFYGPKIDFDIKDSSGRMWQCGTIQLDYQLPLNFGITYTGEDGKEHTPVIIHRAVIGSLERFCGVMVEHYQGRFPTWISPEQARVISVSESGSDYAKHVYKILKKGGIRASLDTSDKTLEYKIREAQLSKVPYMIVVGSKEKEAKTITVRSRGGKQHKDVSPDGFVSKISKEISERSPDLVY